MANRKKLKNPNGLYLGVPGSGKSFSGKRELVNVFLATNDRIIILDPMGEYSPLVRQFGKDGLVVEICLLYTSTVFDGELDATDVFVSLISQKYGKTNTKEYLAKKKELKYNEDEVQKSRIPSGLCG